MPVIRETSYEAPYVLTNRHLATVIPVLFRYPFGLRYKRERLDTPDGDFLDLDWVRTGKERLLLLSHGLEGSSRSPYVAGMAKYFSRRDWDVLAWNYRSCSGEPNRTIGFYHPGQSDDFDLVVRRAIEEGYKEICLVGFSLGGAFTLRYLGEKAAKIHPEVKRAVVFSTPVDLEASAVHLSTGSQSWYTKLFLFKYKRKMQAKEKLNPGRYNLSHWDTIQTLSDFDRLYNVPWFGFADVQDFYESISSKTLIPRISVPTLIVNAENDPFLPPSCYPIHEAAVNEKVFLEIPEMGGHVGFMTFSWRGIYWSESRTEAFFEGKVTSPRDE